MPVELGRGIPRRCHCGVLTIVLTSKTRDNPGRRFYRCGVVFGENHVFKWADDAHLEELEVIVGNVSAMEEVLSGMKEYISEIKKDISEIVAVVDNLASKIRMSSSDN
ncbi:hypothetical protein N665_1041s0008 [Sinapis alba]|nr:hypothetical protein N665_1041s0008 [Sinapis alba]